MVAVRAKLQAGIEPPTAFSVVLDSDDLHALTGGAVQLAGGGVVLAVVAAEWGGALVVPERVALLRTLAPKGQSVHRGLALGPEVALLAQARVRDAFRKFIASRG